MEYNLNDITVKLVDGSGILVLTSVNEFIFSKNEISFLNECVEAFLLKNE
jgi:hypothetical protein